jgi:uncharacterized protein
MENMPTFPEQSAHLLIPGPVGQLEALANRSAQNPQKIVAVICHPNPLHEGSMHNKVVTTIFKALDKLGIATVRFNYRGVGESEGEYGDVLGEQDDLRAVIDWVQQALPDYQLWLAGFSFGAFISASVCHERDDVRQLISIAPAVNMHEFEFLQNIQCPWLVVQGEQDEIVPAQEVVAFAKHPPSPLTFKLIPNVGHFFHGHLIELRELLIEYFGQRL